MTTAENIYVMQVGTGPVKIGTSKAPTRRSIEVHYFHRACFEGEIFLRHVIPVPDGLKPRKVERFAHFLASDARLEGEWFDLSPTEAEAIIHRAIALRGEAPKMISTGIPMPVELKRAIGTFRHSECIGSEAEAIRQLITEALRARGVEIEKPWRPG